MSWRAAGALTCAWFAVACSSREDMLATVSLGQDSDSAPVTPSVSASDAGQQPPSDAGVADGQVRVIGTPVVQWPFEIASWPLDTPLLEFFTGPPDPNGVVVIVDGPDATTLRLLWDEVQDGEYGPQHNTVAVEDDQGSVFRIVIESAP